MLDMQTLHHEICLLLPWHVNGSLSPDENKLVTEHLRTCLDCRRELESLRLQAEVVRNNEPASSAPEHSLEKLMYRIAADGRAQQRHRRMTDVINGLVARIWPAQNKLSPVYAIMWVLSLVLIGLAIQWLPSHDGMNVYHTLSDPTQSDVPHSAEQLKLVVDRNLTVADLHELLQNCRVEIVRGPTAAGAYGLLTQTGQSAGDALSCLRAVNTVQFAEPVGMLNAR